MVKDKNGTEIKIGDTVHYKRPETSHTMLINGRTKTVTIRARDEVFTVTEFVDSPFPNPGIWITGHGLDSTRLGARNAVSPLAVVKVGTFAKKAMPTFSLV